LHVRVAKLVAGLIAVAEPRKAWCGCNDQRGGSRGGKDDLTHGFSPVFRLSVRLNGSFRPLLEVAVARRERLNDLPSA
jgi:hypothetical protein